MGAANRLRGVLGAALHALDREAYDRFFAPSRHDGPSGLADPPRPFVLRAEHLDNRRIPADAAFHFDLRLLDVRGSWVPLLRQAFSRVDGAELVSVDGADMPLALSLQAATDPVSCLRVRFLTPTELKSGGALAARPEFAMLAARIRDRISTLRQCYGSGPLEIDFAAFGARAAAIRMTDCRIEHVNASRHSRATGQTHPLGGFTGEAVYEGDLSEFLPYLKAAEWTGVGRQASWGKGALAVCPETKDLR